MQTVVKRISAVMVALIICLCVNTSINAQSPADDPGIGGPGSPSQGVGGDGGPVVPFDNTINLLFLGTVFLVGGKSNRVKNLLAKPR